MFVKEDNTWTDQNQAQNPHPANLSKSAHICNHMKQNWLFE